MFPVLVKAGVIVGAQGGNGVMFGSDGKVLGYCNASALSYGLQAGAQWFSEAMFLMTDSAVSYLKSSEGWSVGTVPSVVVVDEGMARAISSTHRVRGRRKSMFRRQRRSTSRSTL